MQAQQRTDFQAPRTAEAVKSNEAPTFIANPANRLFSHDDRAEFYTGNERVTLQMRPIQRVRELQEANDNLQRQVTRNEKELAHAEDPLAILAEIEHCNIMIARNTGEILNIYTQNEQRIKRIAELEAQNINLHQEMSDTQGKFITCHDMTQRTKFAAEFFITKAQYEKNVAEIRELSHQ
ncbi:MAG: hypothetical protein JSS60_04275 [Verrucomicrobia bacterium]|nr:hypothetical protein [Verrucomicrobiota bacterium]